MKVGQLIGDRSGLGAVEFALAAPVFIGMVIGISQLGTIYFANAGLKHAVDEAARRAAVYPVPQDNSTMLAALNERRFGMRGTLAPSIVRDAAAKTIDITLSYSVPLNFVFFQTAPVTLTHSRKVFVQAATNAVNPGTGTASGGTATGGTATGGTATGGTATGGTATGGTDAGGTTTGGTDAGGTTTTNPGGKKTSLPKGNGKK